jgi:hypothetical protein
MEFVINPLWPRTLLRLSIELSWLSFFASCPFSESPPAKSTLIAMVQQGVLGNLVFDQARQGWTTYVGDALARMTKWSTQTKDPTAILEYVRAVRTL